MSEPTDSAPSPYEMTISMSVLEALGINLYSNAAAVMAELIANAWDANANLVQVQWDAVENSDQGSVSIIDDGTGMSALDLNKKYLTVGYAKRLTEGGRSAGYGRSFMGRKGIGKLSVFSIADVVEVHSAHEGQRSALRIDVHALRESIAAGQTYNPAPIEPIDSLPARGTVIRLTQLRRKRMDIALAALRKRIARRFDILSLDPATSTETNNDRTLLESTKDLVASARDESDPDLAKMFFVFVNDRLVSYEDKVELKKIQYLWEFGSPSIPDASLSPDVHRETIPALVPGVEGGVLTGWFGTVSRPDQLVEDADAGSLKNIIILSRGRPIQEGIIERLNFSRVFVSYVTGQIRADFLDEDDQDDIATSDRQRLIEDDPRVEALRKFLRASLLAASEQWSKWRPQKKSRELLANNAPIRQWVESLPPYQQESARRLMGTIASLSIPESTDEAADRKRLYQSGIAAFSRIGLREDLAQLEILSSLQGADILPILATLDDYESAMYLDIIRTRVETINAFAGAVADNVLEKVLQQDLHANLWLLDPAWDRVSQSVAMEERIFELAESFGAARPDEDPLKRIDLRYCNVQNRHVIIELKRPHVTTDIDTLYDQGLTYVNALRKVLEETGRQDEAHEVIFVVGMKPTAKKTPYPRSADSYSRDRVGELNGRVFRYQELIHSARAQYDEYIAKNKDVSKVGQVLEALSTSTS